ncbi:hypothetical protein FHG87_023863 [Trinorchestia longiramus]|nr:hypothetical protein FHG87_023863 [Trinorchestia longiramus]
MKREDEVCAEARSEHAEADDKLQEGSSGACNTSAVHQRSAEASQEGADCVPSQVSGAVRSDRYQQNVRYQQKCQIPTGTQRLNLVDIRSFCTGWLICASFALLLAVCFLQVMRVLMEMLTLEALGRESVTQSVAAPLYWAFGWTLLPERDRSLVNVVLLVGTRPNLVARFTSSVLFAHCLMKASLVLSTPTLHKMDYLTCNQ